MIGGAGTVSGVPFERSVSSSRQFIVFGADPRLRGAIADLAEHSKQNVLALLQRDDNWLVPILLNIEQPQTNLPETPLAALTFSQTGSGLKIQLDLLITPEIDPAAVKHELVRAILLEIAYRASPLLPAGVSYVPPPDWLVNGILSLDDQSPAALAALESLGAHPVSKHSFRRDLLPAWCGGIHPIVAKWRRMYSAEEVVRYGGARPARSKFARCLSPGFQARENVPVNRLADRTWRAANQ